MGSNKENRNKEFINDIDEAIEYINDFMRKCNSKSSPNFLAMLITQQRILQLQIEFIKAQIGEDIVKLSYELVDSIIQAGTKGSIERRDPKGD